MAVLCAGAGFCCACMDYGPLHEEPFAQSQRGVFITCEGNFGWDNASLSFYDPAHGASKTKSSSARTA